MKVNIIGVPEHFNLPWQMAIEEGAFLDRGIDLTWTDIPEGTGKMCQMLENNETDLAIVLTEGVVKSITEGNAAKIVQEFIATPLQWGIHVGAKSNYQNIEDIKEKKAAISRFGSGSHLMAYVNAQNEGWNIDELKFEVVHTLDGAVTALTNGNADYFMWEHFTTKPLVDDGTFRRIADCPTPWPCFVIAATESFIAKNSAVLQHILAVINLYTVEFKNIPSIDKTLANQYNQKLEDIQEWLAMTRWSQQQIDSKTITTVNDTLTELGRINTSLPYKEIVM